jgi:hypothetical protein
VSKKLHAFDTPKLDKKNGKYYKLGLSPHQRLVNQHQPNIDFSHSSKVNGFDSQKELTSQWFRG